MSELEVYNARTSGKDYVLKILVKNGPLLRAMRVRGFKSAVQLARASGVSNTSVYKYLALILVPLSKTGAWVPSVLAIAKTLRMPPESLFPEQHLDRALARGSGELEVNADDLLMLTQPPVEATPEEALAARELQDRLDAALYRLPAREHRVPLAALRPGGGAR
jgi:hypothetical protein